MAHAAVQRLSPGSAEEAAALLRAADGAVRIRGGGTKLGWGRPVDAAAELSSERLDGCLVHNEGDLTAVLGAGVLLARAQEVFAAAGQMLALDPPLGGGATGRDATNPPSRISPEIGRTNAARWISREAMAGAGGAADGGGEGGAGGGATVGGVVATGDSGPLRHRYGAPRDLVLGVQLALPDETVARAGSQVIKNVAGYDLAKLCSGAFGTLGLLTEVTVRLHPRPAGWCSLVGRSDDPHALARAASALAHRPLEAEALDLRWDGDDGAVLVRFGGHTASDRAAAALGALHDAGLDGAVVEDDEALWAAQRAGQRGTVLLRVATTQDRLGRVLEFAREHGARVVARVAHALAWVALPVADGAGTATAGEAATPAESATLADTALEADAPEAAPLSVAPPDLASLVAAVRALRAALAPAPCVLLDAPAELRAAVDPWGAVDPARLGLMERVKQRFDPARRCNPGLFVGGI